MRLNELKWQRIGLPKNNHCALQVHLFSAHLCRRTLTQPGTTLTSGPRFLDADGFEAFKDNGIFDPATALSLRRNILERGGSGEPMALYESFRGRRPSVEALLANRGLAGV